MAIAAGLGETVTLRREGWRRSCFLGKLIAGCPGVAMRRLGVDGCAFLVQPVTSIALGKIGIVFVSVSTNAAGATFVSACGGWRRFARMEKMFVRVGGRLSEDGRVGGGNEVGKNSFVAQGVIVYFERPLLLGCRLSKPQKSSRNERRNKARVHLARRRLSRTDFFYGPRVHLLT